MAGDFAFRMNRCNWLLEGLLEETGGETFLALGYLLWGAYGKDLSTVAPALRTDVDDVVGEFDDIEVVFDDDDGVATIHQFLQHIHQDTDVLEMQTRGGLVEDVERLARITLGEFGGEFHTLALTAGEGSGGLTEFDIAETHILDGLNLSEDVGHVLEELHRLVDGHVEHIGDRLALIAYLQRLTVVTLAMTGLAGYLDVGQEVHLDGLVAIAAAGLAAPALHVEGESTGFVAADLGFGQVDKQRADVGEDACVGGWIGARGAPDG